MIYSIKFVVKWKNHPRSSSRLHGISIVINNVQKRSKLFDNQPGNRTPSVHIDICNGKLLYFFRTSLFIFFSVSKHRFQNVYLTFFFNSPRKVCNQCLKLNKIISTFAVYIVPKMNFFLVHRVHSIDYFITIQSFFYTNRWLCIKHVILLFYGRKIIASRYSFECAMCISICTPVQG